MHSIPLGSLCVNFHEDKGSNVLTITYHTVTRGAQNFLDFMQFSGKFDKIVCWRPLLQGILDPCLVTIFHDIMDSN